MKEFFKWVLAVIVGLIVCGIVKLVMMLMLFGSLAASGESAAAPLPKEGVLLIDMSKVAVVEQSAQASPVQQLKALGAGQQVEQIGILDAVTSVRLASEDPAVKFLLLKVDNSSTSVSKLEEFRKAVADFRKSGKPVVAYGEAYTSASYYLASVADKIYTTSHHGGNNFILGVSGRMIFLKDILDRLGVNYQLIRHGKYKSAGEMYVRNSASPENLEQNQEMVNSLWKTISEETCASRGISVDSLDFFIENLSLCYPEDMVKHSLADEVLSVEEYKDKIALLAGKDDYKDVRYITLSNYKAVKVKTDLLAKKKIAVIYADGQIGEGEDADQIKGDRFARIIAKVRADSSVKAVVFRVNSPGGTVLASTKIKEEIDLTREVKPVVASYSDYAASGGYWISNSCDRIYSNATTLTGSIGVFSSIPEFSGTLKNIVNVNVTPVKSHSHSDMLSLTRPFDAGETAWMQTYVDDIYERFVATVAQGRGMTVEAVDEIAQGRVWTGADALKIGLVDEIGTLSDALECAAGLAGDSDLSSWGVVGYPKPLSPVDQLIASLSGKNPEEDARLAVFAGTPLEDVAREILSWQKSWTSAQNGQLVFARMPYVFELR